jgi:hypothetical protein
MKKKGMRAIALLLLIIGTVSLVYGEEPTYQLEPYTQDHTPSWLTDLQRAEIISLGSLPFTTLVTTLGFGIYRYVDNDFDANYLLNPFAKSSNTASLTSSEQKGVLITACSLSVGIALTDFIVIKIKEQKEKKEQRYAEQINSESIRIEGE